MTVDREGFTLNGFLACGGTFRAQSSCSSYGGESNWTKEPYTLYSERKFHSSWTLRNGSVLLMGGGSGWDEPVGNSTELVTPGVGTVPSFTLKSPR